MKRLLAILALCILICTFAQAQKGGKKERIRSLRIAFITDKLQLTPEESEKFWPIYNEYKEKEKELKKSTPRKRDKANEMTEEEADQQITTSLENQEKLLALKRTYINKLKKVIPAKKIARLDKVERRFREVVVKEVQRRRGKGDGKQKHKRESKGAEN